MKRLKFRCPNCFIRCDIKIPTIPDVVISNKPERELLLNPMISKRYGVKDEHKM